MLSWRARVCGWSFRSRRAALIVMLTPRQHRNYQTQQQYRPLLNYLFTFQNAIHYGLLTTRTFYCLFIGNTAASLRNERLAWALLVKWTAYLFHAAAEQMPRPEGMSAGGEFIVTGTPTGDRNLGGKNVTRSWPVVQSFSSA